MFTLKVLGEAVGVQYQGIVDRTTSNSFANALGVGAQRSDQRGGSFATTLIRWD